MSSLGIENFLGILPLRIIETPLEDMHFPRNSRSWLIPII